MERLPKGWRWVKLGDVCKKLKAGGTPSRDIQEYWDGEIPFALVEDLTKGKYLVSASDRITEAGLRNSSAWIVPENSILFSMYASIGEAVINKIDVATNQAILGMILKDKYDVEFVYYLLKYNKGNLEKYTTQTTQKNLNKLIVSEYMLLIPPLSEQQKIAEILSQIDKAIEKTEKIIEKYERIKRGLMQELLTKGIDEKGRIRNEKTHRFKDSPVGRIPVEWDVKKLGEVAILKNGKSPKFATYGNYPIFGSNGLIGFSKSYFLDGEFILIGRVGASGEIHLVSGKFWASDNCLICFFKERSVELKFLYYLLKYINLKKFINYTAQPLITQSFISNLFIPLPPPPEQQKIAEILSQIDKVIEKEQKYKEKLERIKRGLMEDLLTGKVRVINIIEEGKDASS